MARPALLAASACSVVLAAGGCGGGGEVEEGATVSVYAGSTVCAGAERRLARTGVEAGSVRVRVVCTDPTEHGGGLDLSAAGANARRATEDSTSVAFLEAPGPAVAFVRPILNEAEIGLIADRSGARGLATVLNLLDARGSNESPRESVWR